MSNDPNKAQRTAADPNISAWVSASAGSGKTKVLSDRVLNLLLTGTKPEKILCLTFTRTAAAEMANRVADRLAKWASESEEELKADLISLTGNAEKIAEARRLFAAFLDTPGGLKIMTVHSFCQSLLKRFPAEAGISPQFDVLDELKAKEMIAQAQDEIINAPEFAEDLETISSITTEDNFTSLLKEMAAHPADLEQMNKHKDLTTAYERILNLPAGCTPDSLTRDFCRLSEDRLNDLKHIAAIWEHTSPTDQSNAETIYRFLAAKEENRPDILDDYTSIYLKKDNERKSRKTLIHKGAESVEDLIWKETEKAENLKKQLKKAESMKISLALYRIGSAILKKYVELKNAYGVMDYDDLIGKTKELLNESISTAAAWVLFKLDGGIDHILVDEAQDTSPDQWAIIKALADEFFSGVSARENKRTIFVVGDKKQSIFSFQGAVPEKFGEMHDYFYDKVPENGLRTVPMNTSFRSMPAVIEAVNLVLQKKPQGIVDDNENYPDFEHVAFHKQAGMVELWPSIPYQDNETDDAFCAIGECVSVTTASARLAEKIAQKIKNMIVSKELLKSKNRPIQAGDIMILVKKRDDLSQNIAKKLKEFKIPVAGIDRLKITEDIAVKDLMTLGDVLLLPEDDLSLAIVLRSPLCNISEEDLFELAYDRGKTSLFDRLKTYENKPESPLGKAYEFINDLLSRVDKMRPYELYSYVLGAKNRQKEFVARMNEQVLDVLDEFLTMALQHDRTQPPSLQNFLNTLRENDIEIKRDPDQAGNAVRIMTVHASKGLQAPIVFLPQTRPSSRAFDLKEKTYWLKEGENALFFWAPTTEWETDPVKTEKEKIKEKDLREYNRLLYVAMTRAEDRVYFCGFDPSKPSPDNWYDLVKEALENAAETEEFSIQKIDDPSLSDTPVLRLIQKNPQSPKEQDEIEKPTGNEQAPLPDWINKTAPDEPTPPKPLAPSRPDVEEPAHQSPLTPGRLAAVKRGSIIHSLLEILPNYTQENRPLIAQKLVASQMPELNAEEQLDLIESVIKLIKNPTVSALFSASSLAEVPVSGIIGDRVINGRIDRVSVSDSEVLLIDYKTGCKIPACAEKTPVAYIRQMGAYKELMEQIYPDKRVRCFLLWTEAPLLTDITSVIGDTKEY